MNLTEFNNIIQDNRKKIELLLDNKFDICKDSGFYIPECYDKRQSFYKVINIMELLDIPVDYLEIGSNLGVSIVNMISLLKHINLFNSATSIDPYFEDGYMDCGKHRDINNKTRDMALKIYKAFGMDVSLIQKPIYEAFDELICSGRKFNLIHIDGRHDWLYPVIDLVLSTKLCTNGGIIMTDDSGSRHLNKFFDMYETEYKLIDRGGWITIMKWSTDSDKYYGNV